MKTLILILTVFAFIQEVSLAWIDIDPIEYEKQFRNADLVAIIRFEAITSSKGFEKLDSYPEGRFKRIKASLKIEAILKGRKQVAVECELLRAASFEDLETHYKNYRQLALESLSDEAMNHYVASPRVGMFYLCFLTRSDDGLLLIPTTGMAKSSYSFIEVKPPARAKIEKGEQGGADQPATAPDSKFEGKEKPKPESEVRPK